MQTQENFSEKTNLLLSPAVHESKIVRISKLALPVLREGDLVVALPNKAKIPGKFNGELGTMYEALYVVGEIISTRVSLRMHLNPGEPIPQRLFNTTTKPLADPRYLRFYYDAKPILSVETAPKFNVDQIVYIVPNGIGASRTNPILGSEYELDCKIVAITDSPLNTTKIYKLISSAGMGFNIGEEHLISYRDSIAYRNDDYGKYIVNFDAEPFFSFGEEVLVYGGILHNLTDTVNVPVNEELINKLTRL